MSEERHDCGHTDEEHGEFFDLFHLVERVQVVKNPRVALVLTDDGHVHFATTLPPHEAAEVLREMTARLRTGGQYHSFHLDRSRAARWN